MAFQLPTLPQLPSFQVQLPPLPAIPSFQFPYVPQLPGVPAILSNGINIDIPTPEDLFGDSVDAVLGAGEPQWGIYLDGQPVLTPDSIVSVGYKGDSHIADYPIEQGNFESYNKVRMPDETRVVMTQGGTEADRAGFLNTLHILKNSMDLYDVVTPEYTYQNANIMHVDYERRATNGVSLLTVSIWLQEIRVQAASEFTQTAQPSGAAQVNGGAVQALQATATQVQEFVSHGVTGSW